MKTTFSEKLAFEQDAHNCDLAMLRRDGDLY